MANKKRQRRAQKPEYQIKTAKERMLILLGKAVAINAENPSLSKRYFQIAKRIGMRYNVRMPTGYRRKFCRKCYMLLAEGWRFNSGAAKITCKNCGHVMRYPYKPRRK